MKIIFCFLLILTSKLGLSQSEYCNNIYLWDFKTSTNERTFVTNTLSNEVEDILSQVNDCSILQRRKYAEIQKQIENEVQISNVEGISYDLKKKLKTIQAERVLFGEVEQDFSFNVNLRLRLEHLQTKQIKTSTILIKADKMIDPVARTEAIKEGLKKLLGFSIGGTSLNPKGGNEFEVISIEGHKIELEGCTKEGDNLKCSLYVTSIGKDRKIYLMANYYQGKTIAIDEFGEDFKASGIKLGNNYSKSHLYQKEIFKGVRTPLEYTFENFTSDAQLIKVLNIDLHTEELQFTNIKFRDIKIK